MKGLKSAFPTGTATQLCRGSTGISVWDWYAHAALAGMGGRHPGTHEQVAKAAAEIADHMVEERALRGLV